MCFYYIILEMYSVNTEEKQDETPLTFLKFLAFAEIWQLCAEICQLYAVTPKSTCQKVKT